MTEHELGLEYAKVGHQIDGLPADCEENKWLKCMRAQIQDTLRRSRCTARGILTRQEFIDRWQRKLLHYAEEIGLGKGEQPC